MFVTFGQFYIFLGLIAYGAVSGVAYSVFSTVKFMVKNKIFNIISDVLFFILFSIGYVCFSVYYGLPSLRLYMPLSALFGLLLYMKSCGIVLANTAKKLYNIGRKFVVKKRNTSVLLKKDGATTDFERQNG